MLSSDETLEEGVPSGSLPEEDYETNLVDDEQPAIPVPIKKKRKSTYRPKTLTGYQRERILSFPERVEAWHKHVLGADTFDLAVDFNTSPTRVQEGLDSIAGELGFPHNHIDPELERFKIVEAADRMKVAQLRLLKESNSVLEQIRGQRAQLKQQREEIHIGRGTTPDEMKLYDFILKSEAALESRQQLETKTVISVMAEYRATNTLIADLTGIKRSKPVRKPKQVSSPVDILESQDLSIEEIERLANAE